MTNLSATNPRLLSRRCASHQLKISPSNLEEEFPLEKSTRTPINRLPNYYRTTMITMTAMPNITSEAVETALEATTVATTEAITMTLDVAQDRDGLLHHGSANFASSADVGLTTRAPVGIRTIFVQFAVALNMLD